MNIRIYSFNNYYNRIVKRLDTTSPEYENYIHQTENVNFNPNDGVNTEHIFGNNSNIYNGTGDYLLLIDKFNNIESRWFIIDHERLRGGQWRITLRRDLLVDYYKEITEDADFFVEKGYIEDSNPLIFNKENMTFNQIKMGEYLMDGDLKTPWLVAYLPRYKTENDKQVFNSWSGEFDIDPDITPDGVFENFNEYKYYTYSTNAGSSGKKYRYTNINNNELGFTIHYKRNDRVASRLHIFKNKYTRDDVSITDTANIFNPPENFNIADLDLPELWNKMYDKLMTYNTIEATTLLPINSYTELGTYSGYQELLAEGGKTYEIADKSYKVIIDGSDEYDFYNTKGTNQNDDFGLWCWNNIWSPLGFTANTNKITYIEWDYTLPTINLSLVENVTGKISYNVSYNKIVTEGTPYEILVAPYSNLTLTHTAGSTTSTVAHDGSIAMNWFIDMAKASGAVYDIQLLPFVGINSSDVSNFDIVRAKINNLDAAWAIKLPYSNFSNTYDVPNDLPIDNNVKISNECDIYRLVSPNGMGDFEFSPAKNGGFNQYEVDCTLIPFNPYIKINPVFNNSGLYGGDYNDFRGLICSGDFSLPIITDEWKTYQLQNKNYQASFDRQIESMEINNSVQLGRDITKAITGSVTGAISGAATGAMASGGNLYAAAAGAIVGGIASLGGGIADIFINEKLRNEALDLTIDQFGYQLGTIQARPNKLSRTTSFNINNKYFPYIEYYSCKEIEKEALRNKLKFNGMTVMVIGKLKDYINIDNPTERTYIKGQLIRLETIDDDFHIVKEISNEVNKGVYV